MKTVCLPFEAIHAGPLILVNDEHPIRAAHESPALASLNRDYPALYLERRMIPPFLRLMHAVNGWTQIEVVSAWRSAEMQRELYDRSIIESGEAFTKQFVALANHSEHQTGFAVDLGLRSPDMDLLCPRFPDSGACLAFKRQAHLFGLTLRYPKGKESITHIAHEPWHFRYVGVPHAAIMLRLSLTLEEYIDYARQFPLGGESLDFTLDQGMISVSYIKAERAGATLIEVDSRFPYSVSGNNVDGFILTEWRVPHGRG